MNSESGFRGNQHYRDGHDDGDHHDRHVHGHAHSRKDAVDREHDVEHDNLHHRRRKPDARATALEDAGARIGIDAVMDLPRRLPHQEQPARDEDQVPPGERLAEQAEQRLRQPDYAGDRRKQHEPQDQGEPDTEPAAERALFLRQAIGQDGDEDQIVDAEHDLHRDQRYESRPGSRIGGELQQCIHLGPFPRRGPVVEQQAISEIPAPCRADTALLTRLKISSP